MRQSGVPSPPARSAITRALLTVSIFAYNDTCNEAAKPLKATHKCSNMSKSVHVRTTTNKNARTHNAPARRVVVDHLDVGIRTHFQEDIHAGLALSIRR